MKAADKGHRVAEVERWLEVLYIAAEGATLRSEERRKALEVSGMLSEIELAARHLGKNATIVMVDAAAGKSYVGLLAARLVFDPLGLRSKIISIEGDAGRVSLSMRAAARLETKAEIECRHAGVEDPRVWPARPSIVAALHACGPASDVILRQTIACQASILLLVPCCTSSSVDSSAWAVGEAERRGVPRHAPVRRRFVQALIDARRTWALEAAGYQTEVVEFVGATVTPHNLLWRARRVNEPGRMAAARRALELLCGGSA
jgi:hypothetical protein